MPHGVLTVDEIMAILSATPQTIARLTDGLTATELRTPPAPDAWSINEILAHLRASQDVLGGNMLRILTEEHPAWRRVSPRARMRTTDYVDWAFAPSFEVFERERSDLLRVLQPLGPDAWERTATVTEGNGVRRERSVRFFGDWLAGHERIHWDQIAGIADRMRTRG
jgi:DinB superfamily